MPSPDSTFRPELVESVAGLLRLLQQMDNGAPGPCPDSFLL